MANTDDFLKRYIEKILQQQNQDEKPLSDTERKEIAFDLGMTEQEWQEAQNEFKMNLKKGKQFFEHRNLEDAYATYEQAYIFNPYSAEVNYLLAQWHEHKWQNEQREEDFQKAHKYLETLFRIDPAHAGGISLKTAFRKTEKVHANRKSKSKMMLFILVGLLFLGISFFSAISYNGVISQQEEVMEAWSQVENVYQRRADLIPKLLNLVTTSGVSASEETENVKKAYESTQNATISEEDFTESNFKNYENQQNELSKSIDELLSVSNSSLTSEKKDLLENIIIEIEGSENRITVERRKFNQKVKAYNKKVRSFPLNLMGFSPKPYFQKNP